MSAKLQATAAKLIAKRGDLVSITTSVGASDVDSAKPWRASEDAEKTVVTVKAVQYPFEEEEMPDAVTRAASTRFIIAENDTDGDSQFASVDLTTATSITESNGDVWSISLVEIIEPGVDRILYMAHGNR